MTGGSFDQTFLRQVDIHGRRVAYRGAGRGPVMVLVHGMASSSATWRAVLPTLAQTACVVAPDLLGHGGTDPAAGDYSLGSLASGIRDLLVALDHERATIVGHSLGGGVALQFAYQFPERCERLVLVSSGGLGREVSWLLRALSVPGTEVPLRLACAAPLRDAGARGGRLLGRLGLRLSPAVRETWRGYSSLGDGTSRAAFLQTLRSVVDVGGQHVSAVDRLHLASRVPTLIVWGEQDPIIPVTHGCIAHQAIPGSRLEVFEDVGHFPHCEVPGRFLQTLAEFMGSTEPATVTEQDLRDASRSCERPGSTVGRVTARTPGGSSGIL